MNSRSAVLLAGLAAAALLAFGVFEWSTMRGDGARDITPVGASAPSSAAPPANDAASPARSGLESPAQGETVLANDRDQPADSPALEFEVRVRFDSDQRPAAGADVYWFDEKRLGDLQCREDLELFGMGRDFFSRNGRHFVSDAQGIVHVPAASGTIQVVALTETHFGMTTQANRQSPAEPIEVALRPAFGIEVRVLSARTKSPVAEVAVVAQCNLTPDSRVGGMTDPRGIARLWPLFHEDESRGRWHASVPGIFREELRVPFELEERSQPLELTMPDSAPASVRVVDPRGEFCPLSGKLRIGWKDGDGDPVEPIEVRITAGIAQLVRVESGLSVVVRAELAGTSETPMSEFTQAPTGEARARWDLALKRSVQRLQARFVDPTGAPLEITSAECELHVLQDAALRRVNLSFARRPDGSAEFFFEAPVTVAGPCAFAIGVQTAKGARFGGVFHAALDEKSTQLGDLNLTPPSRLFAGRAVDGAGRAMSGADITLSALDEGPEGRAFRVLDCETDENGAFEVLGWAEPGRFELHAVGGGVIASARAELGDFALEIRGP